LLSNYWSGSRRVCRTRSYGPGQLTDRHTSNWQTGSGHASTHTNEGVPARFRRRHRARLEEVTSWDPSRVLVDRRPADDGSRDDLSSVTSVGGGGGRKSTPRCVLRHTRPPPVTSRSHRASL